MAQAYRYSSRRAQVVAAGLEGGLVRIRRVGGMGVERREGGEHALGRADAFGDGEVGMGPLQAVPQRADVLVDPALLRVKARDDQAYLWQALGSLHDEYILLPYLRDIWYEITRPLLSNAVNAVQSSLRISPVLCK